jgi:hypothetical protein
MADEVFVTLWCSVLRLSFFVGARLAQPQLLPTPALAGVAFWHCAERQCLAFQGGALQSLI